MGHLVRTSESMHLFPLICLLRLHLLNEKA
jgi:hypothetical protein